MTSLSSVATLFIFTQNLIFEKRTTAIQRGYLSLRSYPIYHPAEASITYVIATRKLPLFPWHPMLEPARRHDSDVMAWELPELCIPPVFFLAWCLVLLWGFVCLHKNRHKHKALEQNVPYGHVLITISMEWTEQTCLNNNQCFSSSSAIRAAIRAS